MMKSKLILLFTLFFSLMSFSQQSQDKNADKKVMSYLAEAEKYYEKGDLPMAEAAYRKALAIAPDNDLAQYNFGNLYINYKKENEALHNLNQATKKSKNKSLKHKSLHNQGNILMKKKKYEQAAKVYKEALKNDPTDDETRYNFQLAKELMKKQKQKQNQKNNKNKDKDKDKKKDKKKQNQNKKGGKGDNQKDKKDDKGKSKDQSKKNDKKDKQKGKPKEDQDQKKQAKKDQQKKSDKKEKKQARKAKLSKQQVKNILKAIENSEKDVQKKLNKKKQNGKPVKTEKDW